MTAVLFAPTPTRSTLRDEALWMFGDQLSIKIAGRPGDRRWSVTERIIPPAGGASPRVLRGEDTLLYVLEGTIGGYCADQTFMAGPGSLIHLPADLAHCWRAMGDIPARLLVVTTQIGD